MENNKFLVFKFSFLQLKLPYIIVVNQYEWLASLFNINNMECFPEKASLDYDISNYIILKDNHNIRHMMYILKKMESIYDIDYNNYESIEQMNMRVHEILMSKYKHVFTILEKFLKMGPGNIPGIDHNFKCKFCNYETSQIPAYYEKNKQHEIKHDFYQISEFNVVCKVCGIQCSSSSQQNVQLLQKYCSMRNNSEICQEHDFDL